MSQLARFDLFWVQTPDQVFCLGKIASTYIMKSTRFRLDRFIRKHTQYSLGDVRLLLAKKRILVDGEHASDINQVVNQFSKIELDGTTLQEKQPLYMVLNKPKGVVSATSDLKHPTVIDLLKHEDKHSLHIAGRLDFNSTGMVLLTNDGHWSRKLSSPDDTVAKRYRVTLAQPLSESDVDAFARGMYFEFENLTTRPAKLKIIDDYCAEVSLVEGRYHQIKRMFAQVNNHVLSLHRFAVGPLTLDNDLALGQSRLLTADELRKFKI